MVRIFYFIIVFFCIPCYAERGTLDFYTRIFKFGDNNSYIKIALPRESICEIESSVMTVTNQAFGLMFYYTKREKGESDFFRLLPRDFVDYNRRVMHLAIDKPIVNKNFNYDGFYAELFSSHKKVALIYMFFDADNIFTFFVTPKDDNWSSCQYIVEKIFSSIKVFSFRQVIKYCKDGRSLVLTLPYSMPCIKEPAKNSVNIFAITKKNVLFFANIRFVSSAKDLNQCHVGLKKIIKDNQYFCFKDAVKMGDWQTSFSLNKEGNEMVSLATFKECVIVLNLPTKVTDFEEDLKLCERIIKNARYH